MEKTDRGAWLTIPHTKDSQTEAVVAPLPYGQTALSRVRAVTIWRAAAGITDWPVFLGIWLTAGAGQLAKDGACRD